MVSAYFPAALLERMTAGDGHAAGYDDQGAQELMRLYQTIHTDHEVSLLTVAVTPLFACLSSINYMRCRWDCASITFGSISRRLFTDGNLL